MEETELTTIYLLSFTHWLCDDSPAHENTCRFLERRLSGAHSLNRVGARMQAARKPMSGTTG